jgi:hypothetical protein
MLLEQQASKSLGRRLLKKQRDADEIKKWEKEVMRAYESFNVSDKVSMKSPVNPAPYQQIDALLSIQVRERERSAQG